MKRTTQQGSSIPLGTRLGCMSPARSTTQQDRFCNQLERFDPGMFQRGTAPSHGFAQGNDSQQCRHWWA
eukprot:scaffold1474_cov256-Pinguiococcus_pyrenoidosus.AAC.32